MKKTILLTLLKILLSSTLWAQLAQLGTPLVNDVAHRIRRTSDNKFLTVGAAGANAALYKTSCSGEVLAQLQKQFSPGPAVLWDAVSLADGSIVAVGSAFVATASDTLERVFILKTTPDLVETSTSNFLILNKGARAKSLALDASGQLLVLGEVTGFSIDFTDVFLQRVSATTLQPLGSPVIFNNGVDLAEQILPTSDGNFVLATSSFFGNIFNPNALIDNYMRATKVDPNGNTLWQYSLRDTFLAAYGVPRVGGVAENPSPPHNLMLVGGRFGGAAWDHDPFFMLLSPAGTLLDSAITHLPGRQNIHNIFAHQDQSGFYTSVGETENPTLGVPNLAFAQAYELNDEIIASNQGNDPALLLSAVDLVQVQPYGFAFLATGPDNPLVLGAKDIFVINPEVEATIVYQNCALAASLNAPSATYQWYLDDAAIPGATAGAYFPQQPGVYTVQVFDDTFGCIGLSDTLTVAFVTAGFEATADGLTASFTNTSTSATSYNWNFGDGSTSTEANPTHTYAANGAYTVTLVATSNCGSSTFVQTVGVVPSQEPLWLRRFSLSPNPNSGAFRVEMSSDPQENVEFTLFDPLGKALRREVLGFENGTLAQDFDFGALPTGVYNFRIRSGQSSKFVKVVVAR
jgi:hypothetical protein